MKIGILETGQIPDDLINIHGEYPKMFERLLSGNGFEFQAFTVVNCEFPERIDQCDGWLITGSRHGTYEDHAFIPPLEKFIQDCYLAEIPIAGICFGHQIIAQALGGKVEKFSGGWGLGTLNYKLPDKQISLYAVHQDQVTKKPKDAEVILTSDFCENAGFAYRGKAISFQPHPEFKQEFMKDLIEARKGIAFSDDVADSAIKTLECHIHDKEIALQLVTFFKQAYNKQVA